MVVGGFFRRLAKPVDIAPRTGKELWQGLNEYFHFYNYVRPHQSLGYQPPEKVYIIWKKFFDKNK